jgi:hypothetical protein
MRAVAFDQRGIVEIVPGIEPHALGQAGAERLLMGLVEERNLDPVDLFRVALDQTQHEVGGRRHVARAPVPGKGGVEHVAQPVQDHRFGGLRQERVVDPRIGVRIRTDCGQGAGGHQDDLPTGGSRSLPSARHRRR